VMGGEKKWEKILLFLATNIGAIGKKSVFKGGGKVQAQGG